MILILSYNKLLGLLMLRTKIVSKIKQSRLVSFFVFDLFIGFSLAFVWSVARQWWRLVRRSAWIASARGWDTISIFQVQEAFHAHSQMTRLITHTCSSTDSRFVSTYITKWRLTARRGLHLKISVADWALCLS